MYAIYRNGALFALTEKPHFIRLHPEGFYYLCDRADAQGIAVDGTAYALSPGSLGDREAVVVAETDGGRVLLNVQEQSNYTAAMSTQTATAARVMMRDATTVTDAEALMMPDLFRTWAEALAAGAQLMAETVLNKDGKLYRVVQAVTPIETQPPDGAGMLAIYRPIDVVHTGEMDDPIPWEYGMDCAEGKYYSYEGGLWLCAADMKPCVWAPGTDGVWQWQEVTD